LLEWPYTQLPATARPFRRDTNWLGDSHCGQAVPLASNGWDTSMWLGHWSNTQSDESIHTSHSSVQDECKQCV